MFGGLKGYAATRRKSSDKCFGRRKEWRRAGSEKRIKARGAVRWRNRRLGRTRQRAQLEEASCMGKSQKGL